uniref:C2H2-type domain-containing protein n=1 Tax=Cairina moschata TaxID=8855 RepID=A0A8C3CTX1_CAIMO
MLTLGPVIEPTGQTPLRTPREQHPSPASSPQPAISCPLAAVTPFYGRFIAVLSPFAFRSAWRYRGAQLPSRRRRGREAAAREARHMAPGPAPRRCPAPYPAGPAPGAPRLLPPVAAAALRWGAAPRRCEARSRCQRGCLPPSLLPSQPPPSPSLPSPPRQPGSGPCGGAARLEMAELFMECEEEELEPWQKRVKEVEEDDDDDEPIFVGEISSSKPPSTCTNATSSNIKNGGPFPRACPKCNIHFNLMDPLKNHMKYCCPDMINNFFPGVAKTECSSTTSKINESEKGKLIMLVNDFYYGKHEGDTQQVQQEQKTHTTFKCFSCLKVLKNNIRFMNHMKHHLELEKQSSESWESHTTCQHCYRQFPTPFQLQCHIESTHTPYESSTICKICELSFETEQVLLQHMKDNHKPGEMPYVCQVCNYRSSAFSDVETHFRTVHENTKHLLCPFCLKVIKIGAPYMHHYMRHQKKGIYRCTKCRLQFLTCKEKMDHKTQHHRTFRKPKQLEGLPPGTKVTIRASLGSLQSGSSVSTSTSTFQLSPKAKNTTTRNHNRSNTNKSKAKSKPSTTSKKQNAWTNSSSKKKKVTNTALHNLRYRLGAHKCIECYSEIKDFANHFPTYVHCSLCRYNTSCSKAYVNHMMSFHSARPSKRFWIYKKHSEELRGVTVVCLNCDFLTDGSGLDSMATHLSESHTHTCQVIIENVSVDLPTAEQVSDKQEHESSEETKECNRNQAKKVASVEKNEDNSSFSDTKNVPDLELHDNSSKNSLHEKGACCDSDSNKQLVDKEQKCIHGESELKTCQSSDDGVLTDQTKVQNLDETTLSAMNAKDLKLTLGEDVSFEQFLRKRNEPESVSSDISEQGSIHLEPLTPSEVLEHEATEILQKGNVAPSSKKAERPSERTDETSKESSPNRMETTVNKTDENETS